MFMVMSLHTMVGSFDMPVAKLLSVPSGIAIPLFFMVSGYLLSAKDLNYRYAGKKIWNIIKFVTIFEAPFAIYNLVVGHCNIKGFIALFFLPYLQMGYHWFFWYLGAMIIMYGLMPMFNRILKDKKRAQQVLILLGIVEFVVFFGNVRYGFEPAIIQTFRIWNFLFYFFLGAFFRHIELPKVSWVYVVVAALAYSGVVLIPGFGLGIEHYFSMPFCMLYAAFAFIWLYRVKLKGQYSVFILKKLSSLFLPVYSLHMYAIIFIKSTLGTDYGGSLTPFLNLVCVSVLTIGVSFVLMKFAIMRRVFSI